MCEQNMLKLGKGPTHVNYALQGYTILQQMTSIPLKVLLDNTHTYTKIEIPHTDFLIANIRVSSRISESNSMIFP